jgi:hypothetical protein
MLIFAVSPPFTVFPLGFEIFMRIVGISRDSEAEAVSQRYRDLMAPLRSSSTSALKVA